MSEVTVRNLASLVGTPVDKLLEQLAEAGMSFSGPDQVVTPTEKMKLLGFLRRSHGKADAATEESTPKQITLKRRKVQEITVAAGKSKTTVAVEVRQKRTYIKRSEVDETTPVDAEREDALRKLEESRRQQDAEEAVRKEVDRKRQQEETERKLREDAEREAKEAEAAALRLVDEEARAVKEQDDRPHKPTMLPKMDVKPPKREDDKSRQRPARTGREGGAGAPANRFTGQLHLSESDRARRTTAKKRGPKGRGQEPARGGGGAGGAHGFSRPTAPITREVAIGENITVSDLAQKLALKGVEVVKALFKMGVMVTINQSIDHDTAVLVVEELGHRAVAASDDDAEMALVAQVAMPQGEAESRPPVVTIMGHVDHGKTSLLDYIRRTKVASGEAGGITQHIGAYHVETDKGTISFLDTPGHAAFTSMRARGAKLTDIVVLVVAANDGVMPQTIEAVKHARAAGVPLIIAVNKMDLPDANPDNVKQGLAKLEVIPEDWGGDTQFIPLSAKVGTGVDDLLDAISVLAEVLELKAPREGRANGVVIESALDKGRGPVATVLVQAGTLRKGDFVVCGIQYGRVRALFDETGQQVDEAGPSIPVQVLGLSGVPDAGDDFAVVEDERLAKEVAQQRETKRRESRLVKQAGNRMEEVMAQMGQGEGQAVLNLLVKADVQGSVQALQESLEGLSNERIRINVISSGVGGITESDATLATASKAVVIGFNVRADATARRLIEANGVDLRYFSIIYDVIDQVKQVASGLLGVEVREEIIGIAEVRDVFRSSKFGAVAGSIVVEGMVKRNKPIRVLRNSVVVFEGELESLRRFKEIVDEVRNGTECGIAVKQYNDVKVGDQIECFERIEVARTL